MKKIDSPKLSITAVGDISFAGANADKPSIALFNSVKTIFDEADIVIANLEGPLYDGNDAILGKCTIRGNTGWADVLKMAGIDIVSLANNHIMDHGKSGLFSTISVLDKKGIVTVGAGTDIGEACKPQFKEKNGYRVAVLARSSVIVESPSYAGEATPGVAFLEMEELVNNVITCRKQADAVVLLMHWGVEHYSYPTPAQRKQAKELIESGVDIIIGHHPHVVQGYERFGTGVAAYSLGNFLFHEFDWTAKMDDGTPRKLRLTLTPENRMGIILTATMEERQIEVSPVFTRIDENGRVCRDANLKREAELEQLCGQLSHGGYDRWWKLYALKKEWELRFRGRITVKNLILKIFRLRPRHARDLLRMACNSLRISYGKSTNPYE